MNKAEKKLAKKILTAYGSGLKKCEDLTRDEWMIFERWRAQKIINLEAFYDSTSANADHKEYLQNLDYPFTDFGYKEINKNWYLDFRGNIIITIIRDIFTAIAFSVSLILAILKFFPK